jgi:urease accessory protein
MLAAAHPGGPVHHHDAVSALVAGVVHPFSGLDHLVAMVAVGLWSALGARRTWVAPAAFVAALLAGALLGRSGVAVPAVEPMIAASLLAFGLLLMARLRLAAGATVALVTGFAFFHGAAHGTELAGGHAGSALAGMVAATLLLHGAGLLAGTLLRDRGQWLDRAAGLGVAGFGLVLLARLA